jgi:hypothetical protein
VTLRNRDAVALSLIARDNLREDSTSNFQQRKEMAAFEYER